MKIVDEQTQEITYRNKLTSFDKKVEYTNLKMIITNHRIILEGGGGRFEIFYNEIEEVREHYGGFLNSKVVKLQIVLKAVTLKLKI